MADGKARGTAAETAVGEEGALFPQMDRLEIGGGIQHFLHARTALGAFVGDDDDIPALHFPAQDAVAGRFLGVENLRRAGELPDGRIHAGRLHDTAVLGDIAEQDGQAAIGRIGMGHRTDAALFPVRIRFGVIGLLGAHPGAETAGRRTEEQSLRLVRHAGGKEGIAVDFLSEGHPVHPVKGGVHEAAFGQFAQDGDHAARPVHVLDMIDGGIGGYFADTGDFAGQGVDIGHGKVHPRFPGDGQQVQDRIGGPAHRDIQRHRIQEGGTGGDAARKDPVVAVPVVFPRILHDEGRGFPEQLRPVHMRRDDGAVAGQRQADGLGQAIHRIGREHAGAAAAAGAGPFLHLRHFVVGEGGVRGLDHRIDEVQFPAAQHACFHGPAGDEDRGDVQPHRGHEHAGGDFVAVADAHHGVGLVGVHHIFHAVGDDFTGRKGIEHPVVAHGDTVVHGDGVELGGETAQFPDFRLHQLTGLMQVRVAGDELREGIHDGDDRFSDLVRLHAGRPPKGAGACHPAPLEGDAAPQWMFHIKTTLLYKITSFPLRTEKEVGLWYSPSRLSVRA